MCSDGYVMMCADGWCSDVFRQVLFWWCPCNCMSCDVVKYTSYTTVSRMQSIYKDHNYCTAVVDFISYFLCVK